MGAREARALRAGRAARTRGRRTSRASVASSSGTSSRSSRERSTRRSSSLLIVTTTARSAGANDNASGTAALIELARPYALAGTTESARTPLHTLVFLSTDGGAYGSLGAARFAERSPLADRAVAVVSLDGLAGSATTRLELAGLDGRSPPPVLVRTADARISAETGTAPVRPGVLTQLVSLALPFGYGEQAPVLGAGEPALRITTGSDAGTPSGGDELEGLRPARLGQLGRASEALLNSLDSAVELPDSTDGALFLGDRVVRGWALQLLLLAAVVAVRRRDARSSLALSATTASARCGLARAAATCRRVVGARPPPRARRGRRRAAGRAEPASAARPATGRLVAVRRPRRSRDRGRARVVARESAPGPARPCDAGGGARRVRGRVRRAVARLRRHGARLPLRPRPGAPLAVRLASPAAAPALARVADGRRLRHRPPRARALARRPRGAAGPRRPCAALRRRARHDRRRALGVDDHVRRLGRDRKPRRRDRCRALRARRRSSR